MDENIPNPDEFSRIVEELRRRVQREAGLAGDTPSRDTPSSVPPSGDMPSLGRSEDDSPDDWPFLELAPLGSDGAQPALPTSPAPERHEVSAGDPGPQANLDPETDRSLEAFRALALAGDMSDPRDGLGHSPEVREILTAVPAWLLRSGATLVGLLALSVLIGSWIIRYPEVIAAPIVVTTADPPLPVVAQTSGELVLLAEERISVSEGDDLGYLDNPTRYEDAKALRSTAEVLQAQLLSGSPPESLSSLRDIENLRLGELEGAYAELLRRHQDYIAFYTFGLRDRTIANLEEQIRLYQEQSDGLERQRHLMARESEIARDRYEKDLELFRQGFMSQVEFSQSERAFLDVERSVESIRSSAVSNDIQLAQQQRALLELTNQKEEEERGVRLGLNAAVDDLLSRLDSWEKRYVLTAPRTGRVSLFTFWSNGQFVQQGTEVMTILPERGQGSLLGKVSLPRQGAGRVNEGQSVRVKFDRYPYRDFGAVMATVESISPIAREDQYMVEVEFVEGLTTTYGQSLEFRQEMAGTAEIMTDDLRLLERVFNQLRMLLDRG